MSLYYPTRFDPHKTGYRYLSWVPSMGLYHPGNDFNWGNGSDDKGQDVVSPTWGIVLYIAPVGFNGGLGNYLILQHPHNDAYTRYMHLLDRTVQVGDIVAPNQVIGHLGGTGTTSPHCHFEVLNEKGIEFINTSSRPYERYTKGLSKAQIETYWIDPIHWLDTQEHFVGENPQQRLDQVKEALKFATPPRRNILMRLADRLSSQIQ